jgi:hypothetical protein
LVVPRVAMMELVDWGQTKGTPIKYTANGGRGCFRRRESDLVGSFDRDEHCLT